MVCTMLAHTTSVVPNFDGLALNRGNLNVLVLGNVSIINVNVSEQNNTLQHSV